MKLITLDSFYIKPKLLLTMLVLLTVSMFAIHSNAAQTDAADTGDKTSAQRFDHTATGYPLIGAHATIADCGSCHVGGVFKGTTHNCNGCHTRGQRVVALTMSSSHIATTEPCDICHTNTVTFLGARYNHGMAIPGQCASCHNGLIAPGRPSSHSSNTFKATNSCDSCHRPTIWLPSHWNHTASAFGNCTQCHENHPEIVGSTNTIIRTVGVGSTPEGYAHSTSNISFNCDSCHHTFTNWFGASFNHVGAPGACNSCHGAGRATPATQVGGTTPEGFAHLQQNINSIDCGGCHKTTASWLNASYDHATAGTVCSGCHNGSQATGIAQFAGHQANPGECSNCHSKTTWLGASGGMPSNHIPFTSGTACATCHTSTIATGATLHGYLSSVCKSCHDSNSPVYAWTTSPPQRVNLSSHHSAGTKDCLSCHTSSFTRWSGG